MIRPVKSAQKSAQDHSIPSGLRGGYTLVEILVATALALLLMAAVVRIFGRIGESIANARSTLEMSDRLRAAVTTLKMDLEGLTVTPLLPRHPKSDEGYLEYIEGPIGPVIPVIPTTVPPDEPDTLPVQANPDSPPPNWLADTTVGDVDDILMFTTRSNRALYTGRASVTYTARRWPGPGETPMGSDDIGDYMEFQRTHTTAESQLAEVAWFVRGRTLYRRVLLVEPGLLDADLRTAEPEFPYVHPDASPPRDFPYAEVPPQGFFANCDISVRPRIVFDQRGNPLLELEANTLADLTKRQCRYAHRVHPRISFPFDARVWGQLGLPTLRESSSLAWFGWANLSEIPTVAPVEHIDFWTDPHPWPEVYDPTDPATLDNKSTGTLIGYEGTRIAEDVILTNVIGFDVKAWDPGAPVVSDGTTALGPSDPGYAKGAPVVGYGAYVDLGYDDVDYDPTYGPAPGEAEKLFYHVGHPRSGLNATAQNLGRVYDTWSFHYEHDGEDQFGDGKIDTGTNGFDDDVPGQPGYGVVDDPGEMETSPPYPVPLRGIQVKIRVFEPDSRRVREVTIVQDFLPK